MLTDQQLSSLTSDELDDLARRVATARSALPSETPVIRRRRRRVLNLMLVCCAGLLPWTVFIGATLPHRYVTRHWTLTWVGYDTGLLAGLAVTAWAIWRRRHIAIITATVTATLLVADAWFDLLTATGSRQLLESGADAAFVELPLAAVLVIVAARLSRVTALRARYLAAEPRRSLPLRRLPLTGIAPRDDDG